MNCIASAADLGKGSNAHRGRAGGGSLGPLETEKNKKEGKGSMQGSRFPIIMRACCLVV